MTRLVTLGGLELSPGGFRQPKPLLLLTHLALEGPGQRRHLAELFWPDGNRLKSLSMALTRLKQAAPGLVGADTKRAWTTVPTDVLELLAALEAGERQRAIDLYAGGFLEGVEPADWCAELEEWVEGTRERLRGRVQQALLELAEAAAAGLDHRKAAELAERAWRLPGGTSASAELLRKMYPLLGAGRSTLAEEVRRELEDFGALPRARVAVATPALPGGAPGFFGREAELARACGLLDQPGCRLLTLLGPGGSGKTRLARRVVETLQEWGTFPDGIFFSTLEAVSDPGLLPGVLVRELGARAPSHGDEWQHLSQVAGSRRLLLVLDNFEQLRGAAGSIENLLAATEELRILVTSRERLGLPQEHMLPLAGLPLPEMDPTWEAAWEFAGVRLFSERALRAQPLLDLPSQSEAILRICRRLDGMPLALELAATLMRLMPAAELDSLLNRGLDVLGASASDLPARQRSLRTVFETSWRLLAPAEQAALARLSVFRGGFRHEAAAAVAHADLNILGALLDKSWLAVGPDGRFNQHPHLHEFAHARLTDDAGDLLATCNRHADWLIDFAEDTKLHLRGERAAHYMARTAEELANLRAALDFLAKQSDWRRSLRLGVALAHYWESQGYYQEGYRYLTAALEGATETERNVVSAHLRAGYLALRRREDSVAHGHFERALAGAEGLPDEALKADALLGLGIELRIRGDDPVTARSLFQDALRHAGNGGDKAISSEALRQLAALNTTQGHYPQARALLEEASQLDEEAGNRPGLLGTLAVLGMVLDYLGESGRVRLINERALALAKELGHRHAEAIVLINLGLAADPASEEALDLYGQSLAIFRELGEPDGISNQLANLASVHHLRGELREAQLLLEECLDLLQRIGDPGRFAHPLLIYGQVLGDLGDKDGAGRRFEECIEICRRSGETWCLMRALVFLARWHHERDELPAAWRCLREADKHATEAGDSRVITLVKETTSWLEEAAKRARSD